MHIFEESMSMVVVFHVYVQDYTKFWKKIAWEEVYATISDRLCLSVWQYFILAIGISVKSHIGATLLDIIVVSDQQHTVPLKRNVALTRTSRFARDWIIAKKRGVALISLASIHLCNCFSNAREQNGCHAPLIGDYSITSKSTRASECDVALERYRM